MRYEDAQPVMNARILICSLVLLAGCATRPAAPHTDPASQMTSDVRYPFSEIEKIYDVVLSGLTEKYFERFPELDKEHTVRMREYIAAEYSKEKFVKEMLRDDYLPKFEKAVKEPVYRDTKEFKEAFQIVVSVSVSMAKMIVGGQRDIYVAKYVEKSPIKLELFAMAKTDDERQYVSWVSGEVPSDITAKEAGSEYKPTVGDRVFGFCSPEQTWTDLCGRQGFLVVRDGRIAQVIVTMMN